MKGNRESRMEDMEKKGRDGSNENGRKR